MSVIAYANRLKISSEKRAEGNTLLATSRQFPKLDRYSSMQNRQKILMLCLLLVVGLQASDTLIFCIRVDDILSRNVTYLPRSIEPFAQAVNSRGGKVTWAVIPHRLIESQNTDGVIVRELHETLTQGNEICQHGYNHICSKCGSTGHEFYCSAQSYHFDYAFQDSLLKLGMKIMQDSLDYQPRLFVPPAHAVDTTTYRILLDNGFRYLSGGAPYTDTIFQDLFNVGSVAEFTWSLTSGKFDAQLTSALNSIRNIGESSGYYCLLLHDYFIRQGYENGVVVTWIGALLDSLNTRYGGRIKYMTLSEAAGYFTRTAETQHVGEKPLLAERMAISTYPNPFNGGMTIRYTIGQPTRITLDIFDFRGRHVAKLVDEYQPSGMYRVSWNAGRFPSGIYFCRLREGESEHVKPITLVK